MFAVILLNDSYGNDPVPIMAGIYTLISVIGCDELKVPLLFVIVHHLWNKKKQDPEIQ